MSATKAWRLLGGKAGGRAPWHGEEKVKARQRHSDEPDEGPTIARREVQPSSG